MPGIDDWMEKWQIPEPCKDCHYWVKTKCVAYGCKFKAPNTEVKTHTEPQKKEYLDYFDHV
jgi:hypothetical protein